MNKYKYLQHLTFYLFFYLIFLIILVVGYPLAEQYARPIAAVIFPINRHNSLMKNIIVLTGMYWGMVLIYLFIMKPKPPAAR